MSLAIAGAAELPESLTGNPGKPSGDLSMPKPLEKMNSEERQEWLRGNGESKSWSESSLSGFEVPDAEVEDLKSADKDEPETTVAGDVKTVSKGERKTDGESSEDAPSSETERQERHTKAYNELPARMARELADDYEEAHQAGNIPVSREVGDFIQHVLADSQNPGKIYKHLCKNPQLVKNFHSMSGQAILSIIEDIDRRAGAPEKKITKAPPPAREVGGRGSSIGDPENAAISQGSFRDYRRHANARDAARAKTK
jgi:hypothetical protein